MSTKEYYSNNREKIIEKVKKWTKSNHERKIQVAAKRRLKKILILSEIKESKPCKDCR